MSQNSIIIKGARQNNLKNIDVIIPSNKLVVIIDISGSRKKNLSFKDIRALEVFFKFI